MRHLIRPAILAIYRISIALKLKDRLSFQAIEIHLQFYALEYIFAKVKVKFLVSCYLGKNLRLAFTPFLKFSIKIKANFYVSFDRSIREK